MSRGDFVGYRARKSEVRAEYFRWLCEQVNANDGNKSYMLLMNELHHIPFRVLVRGDENRANDGCKLRRDFEEESLYMDYSALNGVCSFLEFLVAVAKRMEELCGEPLVMMFWKMIENIGLEWYSDEQYACPSTEDSIHESVKEVLDRSYQRNGVGGLFPLNHPTKNQREVEIWYQMNAYLMENYM